MTEHKLAFGMRLTVKVYLASSLKNYELNSKLHKVLESKGIECFLPQKDALEESLRNSGNGNHETSSRVRNLNVEGIKRSDIVLAVAKHLGADSAWECGFATGLGKPLILIRSPDDRIEEVYMLFNSVDYLIEVSEYKIEELGQALKSFDFKGASERK